MTLRRACIMGHPVAQSRSPMLHGYWLKTLRVEGAYERADVPPEDFSQPLQLLAQGLEFTDPIRGDRREFVSRRTLVTDGRPTPCPPR